MLENFYSNFGFVGSIVIAFLIFLGFVFWIAGIAGISQLKKSKKKNMRLVFSILFPPYPILWLFFDIYNQSQLMKENDM